MRTDGTLHFLEQGRLANNVRHASDGRLYPAADKIASGTVHTELPCTDITSLTIQAFRV